MNVLKLKIKDRFRMFIPHRMKQLALHMLCSDFVGSVLGKIYSESIPHRRTRIFVGDPRVRDRDKAMLWFGWYERSEIEQTLAYLLPGYDVVELGASIGVNTAQILRKIGSNCQLLAVEINPWLISILKRNIANNNRRNVDVAVVNSAIDYTGKASVDFCLDSSSLAGRVSATANPNDCQAVKTIKLRDLADRIRMEGFILVVDIEGSEVGMLCSDEEFLRNRCFRIILEADGGYWQQRYYGVDDVRDLLELAGFKLMHRHGNRMVFENETFSLKV